MDANHLRFNQSDGSVSLIVQAGFLVKNQLPSISPVPIIIPSLARTCKREQLDRLLCPIRALKFYLKMTSYLESFGFKMGIYTIKLAYRKLINRDISFLKIKAHEVRALSSSWGWSGGAKVLYILHHRGVQLILAYSWARPAILVAGKGRVGMFLFLHFHSCSSFFPVPLFYLFSCLFYLFSPFLWETTQNDPQGLTCR